jgi:dTDP-4-dehydrorhamnose reductase
MKILVTGANGKLGSAIVRALTPTHEVVGVGGTSDTPPFDMTDFASVRACLERVQPQLVVHAAAWTDVDGCAQDSQRATHINGYGTQNWAVATFAWGVPVAYVSTNEVFDGKSTRPYNEYDPTSPINAYGYSKWVGERAIQTLNPRHYIIRTSWLFAHNGKNFIHAILNAVKANKPLRVVTDEVANPTFNDDLAQAIAELVLTGRYGCYHLTNAGYTSRYKFARSILDQAGYADVPITPITHDQWKRASTPPLFAPLENSAGAGIGITLRTWQEAVRAFLSMTAQPTQGE